MDLDFGPLWRLFFATGLPEAYTLYRSLLDGDGAVSAAAADEPPEQKTA